MMSIVMGFFAAMGAIIIVTVYLGYRVDKKHAHKREDKTDNAHDPLDPSEL